ncbi:MAG TPA: U32 family peptidase [Oscillospiraceae bacterium]|nr:U32 family peptidase [Oscillospiraceae bacterium]
MNNKENAMSERKIEILAPAGSMESVYAAVRCGADAVYLGGADFSARQNATNFSDEDLIQAVEYCHLRNVKVHRAINTLVFDDQLEVALKAAEFSAKIGIDALIIQDLGLFSLIKSAIPNMPLHASTQMTIHTKEGALFAKSVGFSRAVAARELSYEQISEICKSGIEIEAFVHGALCMCVSGQCYMSAMIGSRSANRGLCAQACRLPFSVIKGADRNDLSLKDMSLVSYISELSEAGVTSFKIEGRMKRPEYVAAAVTACRNAADGKNFNTNDLQSVFSRGGFTEGYYKNVIDKSMFGVRGKEDVLSSNDVIPRLKELYQKDNKIGNIQFEISIKKGMPTVLSAEYDEISVSVEGEIPQTALNRPTDREAVEKQLSKLGDTVYEFGGLKCDIDDGVMLPASALNNLRRRAIQELDSEQLVLFKPNYTICKQDISFPKNQKGKFHEIRIELDNVAYLDKIDTDKVGKIILPLNEVFENHKLIEKYKEKIIISSPRFMTDEKKTAERLEQLKNLGFNKLLCQNVSHISIGKKLSYELYGGYGLNMLNSYSLKALSEQGLKDTCVSFEMKLSQISELSGFLSFGIIAYGRLPLMLVRNCPIKSQIGCKDCKKSLFDRTGREFKLNCDKISSEILNSEILYMADRLDEIKGADFIILKFYDETYGQINKIIDEYSHGGAPAGKFTRGLYYRGIK